MDFDLKGNLFLKVAFSKKGNRYVALCAELGYPVKYLTFDSSVISEVLGVSIATLLDLDPGTYSVN